jgi:hypothetical protein
MIGKALDAYTAYQNRRAEEIKKAGEKLAEDKKNALASVVKNLIDLASLKKGMAEQLRCLGQNQPSTTRFSLCWQTFESENRELGIGVDQLKRNMYLADPNWIIEHPLEALAIDDLYRAKIGVSQDVMVFATDSQSGLFFRNISINLADSQKLAGELEMVAGKLSNAATTLSALLS